MEINFSRLENASEELRESVVKIVNLIDMIENAKREIQLQEGLENALPMLNKVIAELDEERVVVSKMGDVLLDVCDKYEQTETQIKYMNIFLGAKSVVARMTKLEPDTVFLYKNLFEK